MLVGTPDKYWILPSQGTYSVGSAGNNYLTLTAANGFFAGMNDANTVISGDITLNVTANITTEDGANGLNQWTESPPSNVFTVTIKPDASSARSITGGYANAAGLFRLNGCDRVTIDGSNGTTSRYLTFANTTAAYPTFVFVNDATGNTITYCNIYSSNTTAASGTILFSTTTATTGNDNNTISFCDIYNGASVPANAIYSAGTSAKTNSDNTIKSNTIRNFTASGINVSATYNGDNWVIGGANSTDGNNIYNEAARATALVNIYIAMGNTHIIRNNSIFHNSTANTNTFTGIGIAGSGNGITIRDNYIGGTAAQCGGTALLNSLSGAGAFIGITAAVGTTTDAEIHNNTIKNITNSGAASTFTGIAITAGIANIGTTAGNTIGDAAVPSGITLAGSGATSPITVTGAGNGSDISNNTIAGFTTSSTNAFYGIILAVGTTTSTNVQNNTIKKITMNGNVASSFRGISITSGKVNIGDVTPNNIGDASLTDYSSITYAGNSTCYGIYSAASASSVISNNHIANIYANYSATSAGGVQLVGIYHSASIGMTISGNEIKYLKSYYGNTTTIGATPSVIGLSFTSGTGPVTISQNVIHTLKNVYTATSVISYVEGIYASLPTTGTNVVSRNLVHSLYVQNVNTGDGLCGIYLAAGLYTCDNNMIRLGVDDGGTDINNNYLIYGIYQASATATSNIYFNSVYIGGSAVTAGAINTYGLYRANTIATNVKNNIFMNARSNNTGTGTHYAICFSSAITAYTGTTNLFYTPGTGGKLGLVSATSYTDLTAWKAAVAGQDIYSISYDPAFKVPAGSNSTVDLHIKTDGTPTPIESSGTDITAITYDFENNSRCPNGGCPGSSSAPDIGADEGIFTPKDLQAPVITYTNLTNTALLSNITLSNVTIIDASTGVPGTGDTYAPRIWYKLGAGGSWVSNSGTLTSGSANSGIWSFELDYSASGFGTPAVGNVIYYYIAAQDQASPANIGYNPSTGASHSDVLTQISAPTTPNSYTIVTGASDTYYVGSGQPYTSFTNNNISTGLFKYLTSTFNGINGIIDRNITVYVTSDISIEDGAVGLTALSYDGSGPYTITIKPDAAALRTVSGFYNSTKALFYFNGASNLIIDGSYSTSNKYLVFKNTAGGGAYGTMYFENDANNITVKYCSIQGSPLNTTQQTGAGVNGNCPSYIYIGNGSIGGNYNLTFDYNDIGSDSYIDQCFIAKTTTINNHDITITNNNIFNFHDAGYTTNDYGIYISQAGSGAGSNWNISGNSFYQTGVAGGAYSQEFIYFSPGTSSTGNVINGNYLGGNGPQCAVGTSPALGYYANNACCSSSYVSNFIDVINCANVSITNNVIKNIRFTNTYGKIVIISLASTTAAATISGNQFGDASSSLQVSTAVSSGYLYGIYNTSTGTVIVDNNNFQNLMATGSSSYIRPIFFNGGPNTNCQITNNTIKTCKGTGASYPNDNIGIRITHSNNTPTTGLLIQGNTIEIPWQTSYTGGNPTGIMISSGNGAVSANIYSNRITDYSSVNSCLVYGIWTYQSNGANADFVMNVANNQIYLSNPGISSSAQLFGIQQEDWKGTATNAQDNYYNNSVYISGAGTSGGSACFYYYAGANSGNGPITTLRNNIFVNNKSVGSNYTIDRASTYSWTSSTSNYNLCCGSNANHFYWSSAIPFSTWKTSSGGDANSLAPTYNASSSTYPTALKTANLFTSASTGDLHINKTDGQSYQFASQWGTDLTSAGITTDFDGEDRSSTPDIGSDEFCSGTINTIGTVAASGLNSNNFTANWPDWSAYGSTGYNLYVYPDGGSISNSVSGYAPLYVSGGTTTLQNVTGLTAGLLYWYQVKPVGTSLCNNGISDAVSAQLNSPPEITQEISPLSQSVCESSNVSFTIAATGTPPLTYQWSQNGSVVNTSTGNISGAVVTFTLTNISVSNAGSYTCLISNSNGNASSTTAILTVNTIPSAPTAGNNGPVCLGTALSLTASTISSATYRWSGPNSFTNATQNPTVSTSATAVMAGIYYVTATVNGCSSSAASTVVTVNSLPTISVSPPSARICHSSSIDLTASGATNGYAWSPATGLNTTSGSPVTATVSANITYTVTGTDANGCKNTAQVILIDAGTYSTPLSGTVTIPGSYPTFNGASGLFYAINTYGLGGNLTVQLTGDITETATTPLTAIASCGGPFTVTIQPNAATLRTVSGSLTGGGIIALNGASNVTIDGRYSGSGQYLMFKNTLTATNAGPVINLYGNANNNTIEYCYLEGQGQNTAQGVVSFGTGVAGGTGNSYNTLTYNNIYGGASWATNIIYSNGLAGTPNHDNTISNNNIYNFLYWSGGTGTRSYGINITATGNGNNWSISGNSIYNTGAANGQNVQTAIDFSPGSSSTGNLISNNWIGGKAANGGVANTPWENSYDAYNSTETILYGMNINCGTITIDGNNITNIKASGCDYSGIQCMKIVGSTVATITNNTFGTGTPTTPDNTNIIQCSGGGCTSYGVPGYIYGIWNTSNTTSMTTYDHNNFYYLWQSGSGVGGSVQCLVHQTAGPATITNNNINGPQAAGSADYGPGYNSFGIRVEPTASNTGNIIQHNSVAGPYLNGASALTYGSGNFAIRVLIGSTYTVSGIIDRNVVWDMRNNDRSAVTEAIYVYSTTGGNGNWDITNNQVTLKNNGSTSNVAALYGIEVDLNSASTTNVQYNTVYIGGSNGGSPVAGNDFSSYAFFRMPNSSGTVIGDAITLQNNIFINSRLVGNGYILGHFAIANYGSSNYATNWNVSNNNFLFANNGAYNKIGMWGNATQATLANWQSASSKDANSYTATVTAGASSFSGGLLNPDATAKLFVNPLSDLHISTTDGESYQFVANRATPISITTDYDLQTRPMDATPDIGADEFVASSCNGVTTVSVSASPVSPVCSGTAVTLTATAAGSPTAPVTYQWSNTGGSIGGATNSTYSITATSTDTYICLISNCSGSNTASSSTVMNVNPNLPVSVSIGASASTICAGTSVTFTATPTNGGTTPSYQWKVNGSNATGVSTNSTYTSTTLANNNSVTCVLSSNATCATGSPATSNAITMTVNANLPVSVSIGGTATTICAGTSVTFTATATNGGTVPSYQWKVNGSNASGVSTNSTYTSTTLVNSDAVTCVLISNESCTSGSPATSNTLNMTVNSLLPASVSIGASATTICSGTSVTFTATPTNGGASPSYQWKVNGSDGAGVSTNATYITSAMLNGDAVTCVLSSNALCVTGTPATSTAINITVTQTPSQPGVISSNLSTFCPNTSGVTFTISDNGASNYQWTIPSGTITAGQGTTSITVNLGATAGNVVVTPYIGVCSGTTQTKAITFPETPLQPAAITGNSVLCVGDAVVYAVSSPDGSAHYNWSIPSDANITAGIGTATVSVSFGFVTNGNYTLSVTADYGCSLSSVQTKALTINTAPAAPGTITAGATTVCSGDAVAFSVAAVSGVTSYNWNIPSDASISGQGTRFVTVTFGTTSGTWM